MSSSQEELEKRYSSQLESLRQELQSKIPSSFLEENAAPVVEEDDAAATNNDSIHVTPTETEFLSQGNMDDSLALFVVLKDATPKGLAQFAVANKVNASLIDDLLSPSNAALRQEMVLADGPKDGNYGRAMHIYQEIQTDRECQKDPTGILHRLAVAIALEHATPLKQDNPLTSDTLVDEYVDPVKRYLNYEMAYLQGELDPAFDTLSIWELRFVVDGEEPDETAAWGRWTLRNFRPDHVLNQNEHARYVNAVRTEIRYGSQDVKHDRPELQKYQNILMNGGICGRRAWFGRFMLRAFGIPTTARPSRGHGALVHWTAKDGWVVNLGPGWGSGWTKTLYKQDTDFLATTQARHLPDGNYSKVKRAQWVGDVLGERKVYGMKEYDFHKRKYGANYKPKGVGYWYDLSLRMQQVLLDQHPESSKNVTSTNNAIPTMAQRLVSAKMPSNAKEIVYQPSSQDNRIVIPAAALPNNTKDVQVMKSFHPQGGYQIYLPPFSPQGMTLMRGGTWKSDANACTSGVRILSNGYGKYHNWGFRVVFCPPSADDKGDDTDDEKEDVDATTTCPAKELPFSLRDTGLTIEMVYIKPGKFIMGGENTKETRFDAIEVPRHPVEITKGYYIGKYPVTQAQYQAIMKSNPSKSTKAPDCPVDNIGEADARDFCRHVTELTGREIRLPTEAEWEFACRAGSDTKWFFGDDPSPLGDYAWIADNSGAQSHPVGQKKPNPWGVYDIYGNVCERCHDKYQKDYYAKSPLQDPAGPSPGIKSELKYKIQAPQGCAGDYSLTAEVVTVNYKQRLMVEVEGEGGKQLGVPFTEGNWMTSEPMVLELKEGENTLRFWRDKPPQYGLVLKQFTLTPVNKN